jgi:hypothetical protein
LKKKKINMKHFVRYIAILMIIASAATFIVPAPPALAAKAQTKAEATACRKKFNNKTYSDGSGSFKTASNDKCFADQSNCLMKLDPDTNGRGYVAKCTKDPGTNGETRAEGQAESEEATANQQAGSSNTPNVSDPALASAQAECGKQACNIIGKFVNPFIQLLTALVGVAVVIGIVWGAIQVITSAGDPQKAASGKNHIRNALIAVVGYVLLFGALNFLIPGGIV